MTPLPFDPRQAVLTCLQKAYTAVHELGEKGKKVSSTKVDISTVSDEEAGKAAVAHLKTIPEIGIVYTEEQGRVVLNEDGQYSVILDDIDGTKNYAESDNLLPHGTIIGIFTGRDPTFNDCTAAGYLNFPTRTIYFAENGKGMTVLDWNVDGSLTETQKGKTSGRKNLAGSGDLLRMMLDIYMIGDLTPAVMERYGKVAWFGDARSTAAHIALIALGACDVYLSPNNAFNVKKRKMCEEIGPGYLLLKEAGGAMVDMDGNDLGPQKTGLGERREFDVIAAATPELARAFAKDLQAIPAVKAYLTKRA